MALQVVVIKQVVAAGGLPQEQTHYIGKHYEVEVTTNGRIKQ